MFHKIKQLTKETALYGLSTFAARFLNFFLVPFYTNIFPPAEYGIVTNLYAYLAVFNILFLYGMDSSFLKNAAKAEGDDKKKIFSTAFWGLSATALLFAGVLWLISGYAVELVSLAPSQSYIYYYCIGILVFDNLSAVQFLQLRIDQRPLHFSLIRFGNIVVNITLNLLLILVFDFGVEAVFISNLAASIFSYVTLLSTQSLYLRMLFDSTLFKKMFSFALPYLPAGLASSFLQVIDRPIIENYLGLKELGIYQANYRLGIFMMLFVSMFQFAWQPFFLKNSKSEEAPRLFGRIFTIFVFAGCLILIFFSFFLPDILRISISGKTLIGAQYMSAMSMVPIILATYLFNGIYVFFNVGILLKDKSLIVPVFVGIAAVLKVVISILTLQTFGIYGAAWGSFISYFFLAGAFYFYSSSFFPAVLEFKKLAILAAVTIGTMAFILSFNSLSIWLRLLYFSMLPVILIFSGFTSIAEIQSLMQKLKPGKGTK